MLDQDFEKLTARDRRELPTLEADVWRREGELSAARKQGRRLASLQALVVVVAIVSSATAGVTLASERAEARSISPFNAGMALAPSSLLFGNRP